MEREIAHSLAGGEERSSDVAPGQVKTFEELRLYRNLLNGLKRNNFVTPTKIQAAAIPMALAKMGKYLACNRRLSIIVAIYICRSNNTIEEWNWQNSNLCYSRRSEL